MATEYLAMEPRRIIRTDIAASAIAHLTLVGLIILISEVHPFHAAPTETVAVDIVTPEQLKEEEAKAEAKAPDKAPEPPLDLKLPKLDITDKKEAAAPPEKPPAPVPSPSPMPKASPAPQKQQPPAKQREANAQPQAQATPQPEPAQRPAPPPQAAPAYIPPEPDVTLKYGVMLGLPPDMPVDAPKDAPRNEDGGGAAQDSIAAKLPSEIVAEFRRRVRSCLKAAIGVAPTDKVHIRLRAVMATDGTLAREPILIEASASPAKGLAMLESAKSALQACQPYKMLPADKFREWQVLDLTFSPRDFPAS